MAASRSVNRWAVQFSVAALLVAASGPLSGQATFTDDFNRADGPVGGWTVSQGTWQISAGQMNTTATGAESDIWLGSPPLKITGDMEFTARVAFGPAPGDGIGRHGGFTFFASMPTARGSATGYTLDWIDRAGEYGLRLYRWDPGATGLYTGTPDLPDVPEIWTVQVAGDQIRVLADEVLVMEVTDGTYREGIVGAWAFQNGTSLSVDDVRMTYVPKLLEPCFTRSAELGAAPLPVDFDATCTQHLNEVAAYEWDFGDGEVGTGATTTHTYLFGGSYMITLTVRDVEGNTATAEATIQVFESAPSFEDDFERPDGPVDGWTVSQGAWNIASGVLTSTTSGAESWAWAGDPPYSFPANFTLTFKLNFAVRPPDIVGRHGGVMFCATKPTGRYDPTNSGYEIDWIDRTSDHGVRFVRFDKGVPKPLGFGASDPALYPDPPTDWRIVVEGPAIRVYGDDELLLETEDSTYRRGFFGLWGYSNGQVLEFDDMDVSSPAVNPCFTVAPEETVPLGTEQTFDASCSSATGTPIQTYLWDFGDGASAQGSVAKHTYQQAGARTAKLTITTQGGLSGSTELAIEAYSPVDSFEDDFGRADGPPAGWTVRTQDWQIRDGGIEVSDAHGFEEAWIYAGDPPLRFEGIRSVEFDMEYLADAPADPMALGRNTGVFFFASKTTLRWDGNSGYGVDWLDRDVDGGYRIYRLENGAVVGAISRAPAAEPGRTWRVELDGDLIRLLVDDALQLEVADPTFRLGAFALWSACGNPDTGFVQGVRFDNIVIGEGGGPVEPVFHRGDPNGDGAVNITDGIFVLNFLFLGGPTPSCAEAANANDDDAVNITDGIYILNFLFLGGPAPAAPGTVELPCGPDPAGSPTNLGCESYPGC